jgi:hypothetical protein
MKTLSYGAILCLTTMFAMISGQRETIRRPHQRRALPDRKSHRPRKYWREIQEVPEPVSQAEPTGDAKQQRRPGPRKSQPKARPVHLEGGLSKVFAIPVPPPPQEDPADETEQTEGEEQKKPSDEKVKIQNNSKKTSTVSATSTEGMMWGRGMQTGMQGSGSAQQSAGAADDSDAAQQDESFGEGETMEDAKSKGETTPQT